MAKVATTTIQRIWDCRWSRPGFRLFGVAEHLQPESVWVCVRDQGRRCVVDHECDQCPRWSQPSTRRTTRTPIIPEPRPGHIANRNCRTRMRAAAGWRSS
jgi:hypothetical protein